LLFEHGASVVTGTLSTTPEPVTSFSTLCTLTFWFFVFVEGIVNGDESVIVMQFVVIIGGSAGGDRTPANKPCAVPMLASC